MATGDEHLASFSLGSDEACTTVCVTCHLDDVERHAQGFCIDCREHLCQECINSHKKAKPCRNHIIQGKDTMPSTQQLIGTCLGKICVKLSEDKERCCISGMTMLSPDRLVLADRKNKSIKLVDVNSKSIISRLSLDTLFYANKPWNITSTSSTQVAVTVPCNRYIQFLSVSKPFLSSSYKLSKSHTIQTDGACKGICCNQDKLIVTYWLPGKLEILDMSGRVITKVTTDSTGTDIFAKPDYVQANSRSIYVSDWMTNKVIILNWNGEITGRITDIDWPTGLALSHDGSLLVGGMLMDRVYQVAGDGTNRRIFLQDVRVPQAVCVDDEGQKLYISRLSWAHTLDIGNNILIYNI